ncbi:helix-turn-helix domain-containing protein [Dongia soli]|uniref:Helix-turn-helix transcriptional regulator n=1 Tax=Dongia soli TaxID=600628 RepID=A0ABU5EEQ5_9PROT|nr:helix-turn-helix transcriptional regulator [Dongia soli]MDY0884509.1 helix-turn-helix transcriptional regulator [Dongia soli]
MKLLPINDQFFRDALQTAGKSQREMARFMELDPSAITLMFQGRRAMQLTEAQQIAHFLGLAVEDVLRNAGLELSQAAGTGNGISESGTAASFAGPIPLIGTVDGSGEIRQDGKAPKQQVDAPSRLPQGAVAIRAIGDVFRPVLMRGSLLYFKPSETVEPSAIGRLSVVRLGNKKLILGHVAPGFDFDRYTLTDGNGEKENIALLSATPVLWIKP